MEIVEDLDSNVVFSLADGYVWASWPGASGMVKLGRHEHVMAMMRDYLAQSVVGERLTRRGAPKR
jgi:hypothetical protein